MVLLEGASRIDTADRIDLVVNKKQNAPNVFQEETHNAMEAVLKNIGEGDKQKFVTELAEKTFYTKQQYFLAIEAHKLNLNVKTDKETKGKKQIDKKIKKLYDFAKQQNYDIEKILTEHKNGSEPISEEFYKLLNSDVKYILVPNLSGITRDSKQFDILLKSKEYNKIISLDGSCGNNKKDFFNIVEPI